MAPEQNSNRLKPTRARRRLGVVIAVAALLIGLTAAVLWLVRYSASDRLLLAPMIGGLDNCMIEPVEPAAEHDADQKQDCRRSDGSAAARVEATLAEIGPRLSPGGKYELGYTLNVPLLQLLRREGDDWRVDPELVARFVRTLRDSDRSVVLYLFATHFSVNAPIEPVLARSPGNLAQSPSGPMSIDKYHGLDVYPWSVATAQNEITRRRVEAIDTVVQQICRLPRWHRRKIKAITLLGEMHHLFPNFESGMGFAPPYIVSDYSAASKAGFRAFLHEGFGTIGALNERLGAEFSSFVEIDPPSKDIRTEPLKHFWEHIDSFAHGVLPISGWAHARGRARGKPTWVRIYLNGEMVGRVAASLGRQDVLSAHPDFDTADVGWRFDLRFSGLPYGLHQIDVLAENEAGGLVKLGTRQFAYVDRKQSAAQPVPAVALPDTVDAGPNIAASIDTPADLTAVFFNPLVPLWHEFRGQQVVRYLAFVANRLRGTCLDNVDTYVHQIAPFTNPSWDSTKYAVDRSLKPFDRLRLGISLYGESSYGDSFFNWYTVDSGQSQYGVTEFHPLRAMGADELRKTFDRHHDHGARFLTFFVDGHPRRPVPEKQSVFVYTVFSPDIPAFGSDRLFAAVQALMRK